MPALRLLLDDLNHRDRLYKAVDNADIGEQKKLLFYFAEFPPEDLKLCQYHVIHAGNQGSMVTAVPALEKIWETGYPFFLESEAYWESLLNLHINNNSYMTHVSMYEWMEMAGRLWNISSPELCEEIYQCLIRELERSDLCYLYASALIIEKKLLEKEENFLRAGEGKEAKESAVPLIPEEVWNELYQLSQYWVFCAASLYKEDVFMSDLIQALPPAYRFGWFIMQANAVKASNQGMYLQKVADAAKAYPALKELCKMVILAAKE